MKRSGALLIALLVTVLVPGPAKAGGWWSGIGLEGQPIGMGETISLRVSEVMFDTIEEADRARNQTFYAYLVRSFDEEALDKAMARANPGDWWTPTSEPIRVGSVDLGNWDANLAKARVTFAVPRIAEGSYYLMLCDPGCDIPLGNLTPSEVSITTDVVAARTTRRLVEAEADLTLALQRSRADLRETRDMLRQALSDDADQTDRINALERQLTETQAPDQTPWIAYGGWFIGGAAIALLLGRRRRQSPLNWSAPTETIPDDAGELTRIP